VCPERVDHVGTDRNLRFKIVGKLRDRPDGKARRDIVALAKGDLFPRPDTIAGAIIDRRDVSGTPRAISSSSSENRSCRMNVLKVSVVLHDGRTTIGPVVAVVQVLR
jgi:hypothetical protein